jgi:hypothetical protein
MGHARLVVLIPAPRSCPCGERRGLRGKERVRAAEGVGRRRDIQTCRERGEGREEGAAGTEYPQACMTKEEQTSRRAFLSGRSGVNISLLQEQDRKLIVVTRNNHLEPSPKQK